MENTRKWSRRVIKESKGDAKGAKGCQNGAQGRQKGAKGRPKCIQRSTFGKGREKGGLALGIPAPLFRRFLFKKALKNQCKNRCRKSNGIYEKVLPK